MTALPRTLPATSLKSPPALWAAFLKASHYKSWVIAGLLVINGLLVAGALGLASRPPDVVLVSPDGRSTYVPRTVAGEALLSFVADQRQRPSETTVLHVARDFLDRALALRSDTIAAAWPEALSRMSPSLRRRVEAQEPTAKLVSRVAALGLSTQLTVERLELVEEVGPLFRVTALAKRTRSTAVDGPSAREDRLALELVLHVVTRTQATPDGLEVADWKVQPLTPAAVVP